MMLKCVLWTGQRLIVQSRQFTYSEHPFKTINFTFRNLHENVEILIYFCQSVMCVVNVFYYFFPLLKHPFIIFPQIETDCQWLLKIDTIGKSYGNTKNVPGWKQKKKWLGNFNVFLTTIFLGVHRSLKITGLIPFYCCKTQQRVENTKKNFYLQRRSDSLLLPFRHN